MRRFNKALKDKTAFFLAFGLLAASYSQSMAAETAEPREYYRQKTIKLLVGYGAGGGYDTYARLLAPRLAQKTGGRVVVENHPGGGGLVALNQLFRAKPDGLTIMLLNGPAAALAQLLDIEGTRFDLQRAVWLGRVAGERSVLLVGSGTGIRTVSDLQDAAGPIRWAGGGRADGLADTAACLSEALGLDSRIIIGYKGSKESALAVMRGEADGIVLSAGSAKKYAESDKLRAVAVLDRSRSPMLPDVPTVFEMTALTDEQAWWIDFRARVAEIGKALVTLPGAPADRVAYLDRLIGEVIADPDFVSEVRAKKRSVDYLEPAALERLVQESLGRLSAERLKYVRSVILEKYYP